MDIKIIFDEVYNYMLLLKSGDGKYHFIREFIIDEEGFPWIEDDNGNTLPLGGMDFILLKEGIETTEF
jgi:hypothetical protein